MAYSAARARKPRLSLTRAIRLTGKLNAKALQQALTTLLLRHESLRTQYQTVDGVPQQVVAAPSVLTLSEIDLNSGIGETAFAAPIPERLQLLIAQVAAQPFDLSSGQLIRATLIGLKAEEHVLQIDTHHIASDGWSMSIFFRELRVLYSAYASGKTNPLSAPALQYADFARWQRQWLTDQVLTPQLRYWKQKLDGAPPLIDLPCDRPRPIHPSFKGARLSFCLPKSVTQRLKAISQRHNATLFMSLLTAFNILLHRYTRQSTLLVGTPTANRNQPELEEIVGFFANTLVIRTDIDAQFTLIDLLKQVRETALEAYAHQTLPLEKLVQALQPDRNLSYTPIFQMMFAMQDLPESAWQMPDLSVQTEPVDTRTAKLDLSLSMRSHSEELIGTFEYSTDLFDTATINRMISHFQTLLTEIVHQPTTSVTALPLMDDRERSQVLNDWNQTAQPYPESCLHQLIAAQVARTPEAIAAECNGEQLTYQLLNSRANQLARHLRTLGVGPESLVGIAIDRSIDMLVGLLGILKSGAAYVPLDPSYPEARLAYMMNHSQLQVLVTQSAYLSTFSNYAAHTIDIEADRSAIEQCSPENPVALARPENLAYTIYTSGSTGKPKGVQIEHRAVVNFLQAMQQQPGLTAGDRLVAVTTISFDIAVLELYLPLIVGAKVVIAPQSVTADAAKLSALLDSSKATVVQATPATWEMLLTSGWQGSRGLKILCGGEALSRDLANQLLNKGEQLWNLYGPTEATVWTAACQIRPRAEAVPVSQPLANTSLYILDTHQDGTVRPVPVGIPGEVHIGGKGLARGYLHRQDLTQSRFILDPFSNRPDARLYKTGDLARFRPDGSLEFLGRMDRQVKLRGFRIELGEIETALSHAEGVRQAVAVVRSDPSKPQQLVAYWTEQDGQQPTIDQIRAHLKQSLPDYMMPTAFMRLEAMPLTPNGKIDRRSLPAPKPGDRQSSKTQKRDILPTLMLRIQRGLPQ